MNDNPIYFKKEDMEEPAFVLLERIRNQIADTRGKLSDIRRKWPAWGERTECTEGALTCVLVALHTTAGEIREHSKKRKGGLTFGCRGIGLDACPCCFVCGTTEREPGSNHYLNNIAAFVGSKDEGEKVLALFERGARLDFRASEPNWVQIKIGVCDAHIPALEKLSLLTRDGGICKADIDACLRTEDPKPEGTPNAAPATQNTP